MLRILTVVLVLSSLVMLGASADIFRFSFEGNFAEYYGYHDLLSGVDDRAYADPHEAILNVWVHGWDTIDAVDEDDQILHYEEIVGSILAWEVTDQDGTYRFLPEDFVSTPASMLNSFQYSSLWTENTGTGAVSAISWLIDASIQEATTPSQGLPVVYNVWGESALLSGRDSTAVTGRMLEGTIYYVYDVLLGRGYFPYAWDTEEGYEFNGAFTGWSRIVPEPATALLFGIGFVGLAVLRRLS